MGRGGPSNNAPMPLRPAAFLFALALGQGATVHALDRVDERDFAVGPAPRLAIDSYSGSIVVQTGPAGKIHVAVHLQTASDKQKDIDEAIRRLHLHMDVAGSLAAVTVKATNPSDTRARFVWDEKYKLVLGYVVTVPADCSLDLATRDGGVSVGDLQGSVKAHGSRGVIFLKHIGGNIDAANDEGSIVISRCGGNARLFNRSGDISTGAVGGALDVRAVNGDIDVQRALGAVKAYANAGDITLGLGNRIAEGVNVSTSGGGIVLRVDPTARWTVHASSVWGHVRNALPMTVTDGGNGKGSLTATCNGGGPIVTLHANGGHIDIRPAAL